MRCSTWLVGGFNYGADDAPIDHRSIGAAQEYARRFWENRGWPQTPEAADVAFHFFRCPAADIKRQDPYPDEIWRRHWRGGFVRERC